GEEEVKLKFVITMSNCVPPVLVVIASPETLPKPGRTWLKCTVCVVLIPETNCEFHGGGWPRSPESMTAAPEAVPLTPSNAPAAMPAARKARIPLFRMQRPIWNLRSGAIVEAANRPPNRQSHHLLTRFPGGESDKSRAAGRFSSLSGGGGTVVILAGT